MKASRVPTLAVAAAVLALHLAFAGRYGWFRDELYYVACAKRLAWGYVDHPPVVAAIAWLSLRVWGESLVGLRAFAALAAAATAILAGELARTFGGGRFAQALAAFTASCAPYMLVVGHIYTMNGFEPVFWSATYLIVAKALRRYEEGEAHRAREVSREDPAGVGGAQPPASTNEAHRLARRSFVWLGPVVGLGVLNKHSAAWPVVGLALGILATRARGLLLRRETLLAAFVATCIVAPHVAWQIDHGFPTREFAQNALSGKNEPYGVLEFVGRIAMLENPLAAPIWALGLGGLLFARRFTPFRPIGVSFVLVCALIVATQAKAYYVGPAFGALFAAGATHLERLTDERLRWVRVAAPAILVAVVVALLPMTVPVLSVDQFQRYAAALGGFGEPKSGERLEEAALPQLYADMHGWPELGATVARVVDELPPEERAGALVLGDNYGHASAVEFFGGRGLVVASGSNGWWLWGPPSPPSVASVETWPVVVVAVGFDVGDLTPFFGDVREVARSDHPLARADERRTPILVCRDRLLELGDLWPRLKRYR